MLCRLNCLFDLFVKIKAFKIRKNWANFRYFLIINEVFFEESGVLVCSALHEFSFIQAILIDPLKILFFLHVLLFGDALIYSVFERGLL